MISLFKKYPIKKLNFKNKSTFNNYNIQVLAFENEKTIVKTNTVVGSFSVPVFPGCEKSTSTKEAKKCFSKNVQMHFSKKFDANLPNNLGLKKGRKRVFIAFKIDRNGDVVNVNAKAPHPSIKSEVIKIMKQLPKMKPGNKNGKPVNVKYSIPFTMIVE